jgi:hypothetical protein
LKKIPCTTGNNLAALGITAAGKDKQLYATFGVEDLRSMILRPDKRQITKEIHELKAKKIRENWPLLKIIEWGILA